MRDANEPTLAVLLASLSRRVPDWGLVAMAVGGLVTTAAILLFDPPWWRIVTVSALLSAFGAWGIGERERGATGTRGMVFAVMRSVAAVASAGTLVILVLQFFGTVLGTWIS
ncbi:MAG: hypothetical protein IPF87_21990 [Gemmatimonadetes bacterium]|nr:hypothetical protein [Gemmatimonadota bacterium]MBP9107708.1 hypothetical protein [Gemmatimonadaceae bacterium]MBK6458713.1 hypothetical protein [Gemmatimonadota bacterium]MBK6843736.1 hypothetical protein [Gemmatimonadota bacterium]MBK7833170.1 hypothetical protein [Gemmatimonadota bacterium]